MPEYEDVRLTPRYAPRLRPTPIPASAVFDEPTVCVAINAGWVSHMLGVLETMDQPDTWIGTPEEIDQARQMVNALMLALREGNCEDMAFDIRQKPGSPCIIQKTRDGVIWEDAVDLLLCEPAPTKPPITPYDDVRVGPVSGVPETSLDGGTTWTPIPETPGWFPARSPSPGDTQEEQICAAASRAAYNLSEFYRNTYGAVGAGIMNTLEGANEFLSKLNNLLAGIAFGAYYEVVRASGFIDTFEADQYSAPLLSDTARKALTCLLIEHGTVEAYQVVSFDYGAVVDNVIDKLGANPGFAVWTHLNYLGQEGLNAFGDVGFYNIEDCENCIDPDVWKAFGGNGLSGLTFLPHSWANNGVGTYDALNDEADSYDWWQGSEWRCGVIVKKDFAAIAMTSIRVVWSGNSYISGRGGCTIRLYNGASLVVNNRRNTASGDHTLSYSGTVTGIQIEWEGYMFPMGNAHSGSIDLIEITGTGPAPL